MGKAISWLRCSQARVAGWLALCACVLLAVPCSAVATEASAAQQNQSSIHFGILPIGSAAESRKQWQPLLDDLASRLGTPVTTISVSSYAGLSSAIADQRVDIAFLSGRLAIEAVLRQHMGVVAQFVRTDGAKGNVGMLVVRTDGPIRSVGDMLAQPGRWRYARGEPLSVTGYVAPEAEVFAPRGLNSDTFFASVHIGNHQNNMLAVANGEADISTTNNPDLDLFRRNFPREAAQLKVIWRSTSIPCGVLVVRRDLAEPLRSRLVAFMRSYGKGSDAAAGEERVKLAQVPDLAGFDVADGRVLKPFVDMEYTLLRQQAKNGRWVSEEAREARLRQIETQYRQTLASLRP